MRADYGDVKLKIGKWILMRRTDSYRSGHHLYHQCDWKDPALYPVDYEWGNWQSSVNYQSGGLKWRCLMCLKVAHEGAVAAWMMLEPERTWKNIERKTL